MRRADRQVTGNEIIEIIARSDVCRVGMADGGTPYIVPMNFGYTWEDSRLTLYFHCAKEGKKIDILRRNNRVCFEMDGRHRLIEDKDACKYSFAYESVMGEGTMSFIEDDAQKAAAFAHIMQKQTGRPDFSLLPAQLRAVCVLRLDAHNFTGKRAHL